jgi:ribosomal protein S4
MKGDTGQNLIGLLEQRLDMVVYRAKFAPTIFRPARSSATATSASTA